jgi:pimeloyl-ACP methyl ester carboxylesterase
MRLEVNGRGVHVATGGRPFDASRPAVVFLHGSGCDHSVWQLPARWFAWHGHSVLAVDLPGHGRSEGPPEASIQGLGLWVGALLDAAKVRTAALIGHSMGGAIALEAAAALGDRIARLALLGTAASIPVHRDLLAAAGEDPDRAYQMMTGWGHDHRAKIGGNPAPGLWMTGSTLALFARNQRDVLHTDLAACSAWKSGPQSARVVRSPTLVLIARNDIMTPPKAGAELAGMIAGSRSVIIDRCGHMLMAEAPDAVLDALIEFFAKAGAA